jgi:serine/threonine-protein kinase
MLTQMKTGSTVVLSAVVSAAMWLLMQYVVGPHLPVSASEVPPLVGLSTDQARGLLEPRGLLLALDGEKPDATVAAGSISEQKPLGGSRLRRGESVHAILAKQALQVPNVVGMTPDQARAALDKVKLKAGKQTDGPSDSVPKGQVASANPAVGAIVNSDTVVDLVVSVGPPTQAVPSVVGKRLSSAKSVLEQAGFAVGATRYGSSDDFEQGIVIRQNPAAGSQASPGVKIDLVIND